jgi:hypothetical protein
MEHQISPILKVSLKVFFGVEPDRVASRLRSRCSAVMDEHFTHFHDLDVSLRGSPKLTSGKMNDRDVFAGFACSGLA